MLCFILGRKRYRKWNLSGFTLNATFHCQEQMLKFAAWPLCNEIKYLNNMNSPPSV